MKQRLGESVLSAMMELAPEGKSCLYIISGVDFSLLVTAMSSYFWQLWHVLVVAMIKVRHWYHVSQYVRFLSEASFLSIGHLLSCGNPPLSS